ALGLDDHSLASFPEEFRQGMATRAEALGMTGANHPEHWRGGLASTDLHAIVILFARDVPERERCRVEHEKFLSQCKGVEVLSSLDLEAIPPFDYAHEHFGYRDRQAVRRLICRAGIRSGQEDPTVDGCPQEVAKNGERGGSRLL